MDLKSVKECRYLVIGDPIAHSRSPEMQNAGLQAMGINARYGKLHVTAEELPEFTQWARIHLDGFNITVPHKERIREFLDEADPAAGSINTVICRNGRLLGYSTDGYGLEKAAEEAFGISVSGRKILFAGTGGAARAAALHLAGAGAAAIMLVNRTASKAEKLAADIKALFPETEVTSASISDTGILGSMIAEADILIQCTSLGLKADDPMPFPAELLLKNPSIMLFDTIYRETPLLKFAAAHGIKCADGRWMLLHQGVKSLALWSGREVPVEAMRQALAESYGEK